MAKLFYTVSPAYPGMNLLRVYEIVLDQPKLWFEFGIVPDANPEEEIQTWLDSNGFEDREYEFERL